MFSNEFIPSMDSFELNAQKRHKIRFWTFPLKEKPLVISSAFSTNNSACFVYILALYQ